MTDTRIVKNEAESRYEAWVGESLAGFANFSIRGDVAVFPHTEVDPAFAGCGLASAIIAFAMDDVKDEYAVWATCPFVKAWIDKHPEAGVRVAV